MKSLKTILGVALSIGGLGTAATVTGVSIAQADRAVVNSQVEAVSSGDYIYAHAGNASDFGAITKVHLWGSDGDYAAWDNDPSMSRIGSTNTYYFQLQKDPAKYATSGIFRSSNKQTGNLAVDANTNQVFHGFSAGSTSVDKATLDNWALATSLNSWGTTTDLFTFSTTGTYSHRYYISYHFTAAGDFKLVNTSKSSWNGCHENSYNGITGVETTQNSSQDGANYHVASAGTLTIWMTPTANAYGKTSYIFDGTEGQMTFTPDPIDLTLSVTFSTAVPSYVDIYIPGDIHGWNGNNSLMSTDANRRTFTIAANGVDIGNHEYKLVACYHSTGFAWNNNIDTDNVTMTISVSDAGTAKSIRTNVAVPNMPQETVASGAVITVSFSVAIPNTVDIIYVGNLTNWGTTPANISAGIMAANANRKLFTWTIPSNTYTGSYNYKIVAMSKYTTAQQVSYDHIVYGNAGSDETMVLDTTTTTYSLVGNDIDLIELAAYSFSEGFNSAMAVPCADPNADNKSAVSAIWGTWKSTFEGLPTDSKTEFRTSSGEVITQARSTYLHCAARYGLAAWDGAPQGSSNSPMNLINSNSNNTTVYIAVIAVLALSVTGAFFILRKKKHN